jgi:outer membrane protein OmpA-like peptidoglycan-associated protein
VAPNATPAGADDPAGRAKNRRVEIVVRKAG